jgi:Rrf2 family transcriptional regulator, repressor of oqxAB
MSSRGPFEAGWFRVAVQALVVIAGAAGPCSSAAIAQDVDAHAVFLRRVLAQLAQAGIVQAREGRTGGYQLARAAGQINLAEVYSSVKLAGSPSDPTPGVCALASDQNPGVDAVLDEIRADVERHILQALQYYTLQTVIEKAITA